MEPTDDGAVTTVEAPAEVKELSPEEIRNEKLDKLISMFMPEEEDQLAALQSQRLSEAVDLTEAYIKAISQAATTQALNSMRTLYRLKITALGYVNVQRVKSMFDRELRDFTFGGGF